MQRANASRELAAAVTDRIWPNVMLQWEWLGGLPPLRRAAVIGGGSWGTAVAAMLARSGIDVDLGCRTKAQADLIQKLRADAKIEKIGGDKPAEAAPAAPAAPATKPDTKAPAKK